MAGQEFDTEARRRKHVIELVDGEDHVRVFGVAVLDKHRARHKKT